MFHLSIYSIVLLVHVFAACLLVGSSIFEPLKRRMMLEAGTVGALRPWLEFTRREAQIHPPTAMALLATGLYLGSAGWWYQGWFYVAIAGWLANSLLAVRVVKVSAMALGQAAGRADEHARAAELEPMRHAAAWDRALAVMRGTNLAMLYMMLAKPSLVEACIVLAIAVGVSLAFGRTPRPAVLTEAPAFSRNL